MTGSNLTAESATALAGLIRTGQASSVEVVEAHIAHIALVDGAVNALARLDGDRALAAAREADASLARGEATGVLHGVPFTVKDNISAAGIEMTIGVAERVGVVPDEDATAVARMKAAGAILLGKTNCPPYGGGIETDNEVNGRTNNPFDLARTPGGSSGGEAAIIAAGGSPCGLGTDSGASARLPAHFCGLAAIKPTAGRVPVTGVIDDLGQIGALSDPRTQIGVLARSVADVVAVLRIVAGPDGHDGGLAPVPLGDPADVEVSRLRVALMPDNGIDAPTDATVATVQAAAEALAATGARVTRAAHPAGGHALTIEVWRSYGAETRAEELYDVLRRWDGFRSAMLAFMAGFDLLLCPVFPGPAPEHGRILVPGADDPTSYTTPHSLTGWPAATLRCGTSPDGLPIGVQVVAAPWREDVALAAALELERALGPHPQARIASRGDEHGARGWLGGDRPPAQRERSAAVPASANATASSRSRTTSSSGSTRPAPDMRAAASSSAMLRAATSDAAASRAASSSPGPSSSPRASAMTRWMSP
jgi:amidase